MEEYLVDLNGTQAAIRAGYSPKAAHVQASRLLSKTKVADAIAEKQAKAQRRTEITVDAVLEGLRREATAEHNSGATRVHAWTQLAKALGMFYQNVQVTGTIQVRQGLGQARVSLVSSDRPVGLQLTASASSGKS